MNAKINAVQAKLAALSSESREQIADILGVTSDRIISFLSNEKVASRFEEKRNFLLVMINDRA